MAASFERSASDLTSSATTAKHRPASPARAASTAALSARRFVGKAISLMSLMICDVPSAAALIFPMALVICSLKAPPWVAATFASCARPFACWALSDDCLVTVVIECSDELVSSSELACSEAPSATAWLEAAIWPAADDT